MKKITIDASVKYDILIEKGLIDRVGELSLPVTGTVRAAVVSDDTVFSLYGERVIASLELPPLWFPTGRSPKVWTALPA